MALQLEEVGVVKVATPCKAKWSQMKGTDTVRRCELCNKNVYHLSRLTSFEARDLLLKSEGKLCVRFFARDDGSVLTQDCAVGVRSRRRRLIAAAMSAVAMLIAAMVASLEFAGMVETSRKMKTWASSHELKRADAKMRGFPSIEGGKPMPNFDAPASY
jgi:hypothetical protein